VYILNRSDDSITGLNTLMYPDELNHHYPQLGQMIIRIQMCVGYSLGKDDMSFVI
jgi:hypothetical protein